MRISRLQLNHWKNFTAVDLKLQERVFVVGPNAGGKSNLFDSIRFLHDLTVSGGGLIPAVMARGSMTQLLPFSMSNEKAARATICIETELKESDGVYWTYKLEFRDKSQEAPYPIVERERVTRVDHGVETVLLDRPDDADRSDEWRLTQTALQQTSMNGGFRVIEQFFRSVGGTRFSNVGVYENLGQTFSNYNIAEERIFGLDLLASIKLIPPDLREKMLKRLTRSLQQLVPDLDRIEWHPSSRRRTFLRIYRKTWSEHKFADETHLSDGTLRLMDFFLNVEMPSRVVLIEGPETSLPPAVLSVLVPYAYEAQRSGGCAQLIVSTHSPMLLHDPGIAAEEIVLVRPNESGGSDAMLGSDDPRLRDVMQLGMTAAEAVFPLVDDPSAAIDLLRARL